MTLKPFDLNSIRRNWERAAATIPVHSADRLSFVQPPLDVFAAGGQLLERLRHEVHQAFPGQRTALDPFVQRVESCFERLRARVQESDPDAPELAALRAQLAATLCDLEDICEAFMGTTR